MLIAASAPAWTGAVAGAVAGVVFVVFSGWIVLQRVRQGRKDNDG